jgi:putative intracellular protease/amidase
VSDRPAVGAAMQFATDVQEHHELVDVTTTKRPRVLMVAANPGVSTTTGWKVGVWAAELFHPYYEFVKARYEVTIASPDGGKLELDAASDPRDESRWSADDMISMGALHMPEIVALLDDTPAVGQLDLDGFDALVICGGQGPMFQFRDHEDLKAVIVDVYEAEKPTAALCHGVVALLDVKLSDGSYLIENRTITGFANVEEDFSDAAVGATIMPYRIEDAARERGAHFIHNGLFRAFATRDGNLITGQQQYSGEKVARLVIESLGR